jgi:hypothetical protein
MGMRNSVSRISKRRTGALGRRLNDQRAITKKAGIYQGLDEKALAAKATVVAADIENLGRKGIRV